ncbi:MAG: ornithine carbamoyltransferase [Planctomycetota bacterium]
MHLLSVFDLDRDAILTLLSDAARMKSACQDGLREPACAGYMLGLLFEKPSLRTRVSFESGMAHLGGASIYLGADAGWGKRESLEDFARVFSSYVDVIAFRGFEHTTLNRFAEHASCPVVNALTNESHPCQALGDLFTLYEQDAGLASHRVVFVGDANNVAKSLAAACAITGVPFVLASPAAYRFSDAFLDRLRSVNPDLALEQTDHVAQAVEGATAIYTDVWTSMGFESEKDQRQAAFAPFQVNAGLMAAAGPQARFMHCLPANRGEEVTDEVIDGPQSVVVRQAENRMHIQKAIIRRCLHV